MAEEIQKEIAKLEGELRDVNSAMNELDGGNEHGGKRNIRSTLRDDELRYLTGEQSVILGRISELKAELASLSDPTMIGRVASTG